MNGVLFTAQAAGRQMEKFGNGGSIILIASMSGSIVNKASPSTYLILCIVPMSSSRITLIVFPPTAGPRLGQLQQLKICSPPNGPQHGMRVRPEEDPGQLTQSRPYLHQVRKHKLLLFIFQPAFFSPQL